MNEHDASSRAPRQSFLVCSRGVIMHEGKILAVVHPRRPDVGVLPGGHVDHGENPRECLARELIEELGIEPRIGRLLYVHSFQKSEDTHYIEFLFEVLNGEEYTHAPESDPTHAYEITDTMWVGPESAIALLPAHVQEDLREGTLLHDQTEFFSS